MCVCYILGIIFQGLVLHNSGYLMHTIEFYESCGICACNFNNNIPLLCGKCVTRIFLAVKHFSNYS